MAKTDRNITIYSRYKAGEALNALAKEYGLSRTRVVQIIEGAARKEARGPLLEKRATKIKELTEQIDALKKERRKRLDHAYMLTPKIKKLLEQRFEARYFKGL